ncbi:MAG TPA: MBL fold metallo-hydrolase [Candidatus Paceibacterota bacterium]|nr:MBL fold metallo-hydrolase [Candidatus Paceibacterota bacterium]
MAELIFRIRIITLTILLVFVLILFSPAVTGEQSAALLAAKQNNELTVAFLDVGQGDAIYIETFDGVQVLIDGGASNSVLSELGENMPLLDRSLDVVLATHSDKDHIGGLVEVLARYEIDQLILTENTNDTAVARAFAAAVAAEGAPILLARAGQEIILGASTTLVIYSPATNPATWESNSASIVAQLKYGETEFMLTGDASINIEEYLVGSYGPALKSEVLKLGHHGSRTSTAELFLDMVTPIYAVASAGKDNSYGHPHAEVVNKLTKRGISLLSTADLGTIVFKSDGERVWVE